VLFETGSIKYQNMAALVADYSSMLKVGCCGRYTLAANP
jgi:hypothetical protein